MSKKPFCQPSSTQMPARDAINLRAKQLTAALWMSAAEPYPICRKPDRKTLWNYSDAERRVYTIA